MKSINFANMAVKLSRNEMKMILGGIEENPGGCPGILLCVGVQVGDACPDVGDSQNCTCRKSNGEKVCMP